MLATNTMRYGFDTFSFNKSGLITAKQPWDCTTASEVNGFTITKTIPANCDIRIAFAIDSKIQKLSATGTLTDLLTQSYTTDSILSEGNTVAELEALTSIPVFVGKSITPIIAMISPPDAEVLPQIKLALKTKSNQDQYTKVVYSGEYTISTGEAGMMYDARLSTAASEGGSVVVEASIKNGETWSEYMPLMSAKNKPANAIKFKATYTATTLGVSSAKINSLLIYCRSNNSVILGTNADIITKTQDFGTGMLYARLLVKHERLQDSRIKAYISFTESTFTREKLNIGTGTSDVQTIQLNDNGIDHSSIRLYFNLQQDYNFDYNSELNQITFTAPQDANVFVSYTYGLEPESWQAMQFGSTQKYNNTNYYSSDFTYEVSAGTEKGVSAIRIVLEKPINSSKDATLGTGTGRQQIFILDHYAQPETLIIKATGLELPRSVWNYDDVNKILTIVAPKDAQLTYDCVWNAETPVVKGFVCAWNE